MNTKTTSPIDEEIENSSLRTGSQTTISELPTISPLAITDKLMVENDTGTYNTTVEDIVGLASGGGTGGGTGDGTILTLDINDYLDTTTIDCLDLDPSIVVLHLIHTGSLPTAKSSLEIAVINISLTKIERITFAPSESIVLGSSSDANYKKQLEFFGIRLYSTTIEAGTLYRPENAPSALVVVMDTSFFMPLSKTTVNVGLLEAKYSFYMERDPITNEVKELFFHDANVLFSTSKDSDIATS